MNRVPSDMAGAEETFRFGYTSITERHLDPVDAASIALEGLRGLSAVDPALAVSRSGERVVLSFANREIARYPAPAARDVDAWARLTVTIAAEARGVSQPLREAGVEKIYEAVFDATLAKLDMFSRYSGASEARDHRASRNGFGGLGLKFELVNGEAKVTEVIAGAPAAGAGLHAGDVIAQVDGQSVIGVPKDELSRLLRGPVASNVTLSLRRSGKPVELSMNRALIVPPTVTGTVRNGIAEIKIASFNQRTASSLKREIALSQEQTPGGLKGVVLDMRGNPGGLLDQAVSVSDLFIKSGPIVSTKGRHDMSNQSYEAHAGDIGEDLPVVVLVDGKSASSAEIVSAALQDSGRAVVIGTNSYGKGTVQTVIHLPNDGEMTLTWSRFHTPSGYALHGLGVLPTLCTGVGASVSGVQSISALPALPVTLEQWRGAKLTDTSTRTRLRATCPAASHGNSAQDMQIAERLLQNPELYRQTLQLSAPVRPSSAPVQRDARAVDTGPASALQGLLGVKNP